MAVWFRPAAQAWEEHYAENLVGAGFVRGQSCSVIFHHPVRDISRAVHGDDFTFVGEDKELRWITDLMKSWFEIKVRGGVGTGP